MLSSFSSVSSVLLLLCARLIHAFTQQRQIPDKNFVRSVRVASRREQFIALHKALKG